MKRKPKLGKGQKGPVGNGQCPAANAQPSMPSEGQQHRAGTGQISPADARLTIDAIRALHRQRCYYMKQRIRIENALAAAVRSGLGWSRNIPEKEQEKIKRQAKELIASGGGDTEWREYIEDTKEAVAPLERKEDKCLKSAAVLAEQLPVWDAFGESVRGFGAGSLAVIVGEAGDLSDYSSDSKLWKRMGLAVIDGVRQGGLFKGSSAEAWIEHGYNRQRRSRMWNIGDALIKGNRDGRYRTIYLARKEYELARNPEMRPIQAHRRAQRYMEKRLLRDLWRAWRDGVKATAALPVTPKGAMPTPQPNEREAKSNVPNPAKRALPTAHPELADA